LKRRGSGGWSDDAIEWGEDRSSHDPSTALGMTSGEKRERGWSDDAIEWGEDRSSHDPSTAGALPSTPLPSKIGASRAGGMTSGEKCGWRRGGKRKLEI